MLQCLQDRHRPFVPKVFFEAKQDTRPHKRHVSARKPRRFGTNVAEPAYWRTDTSRPTTGSERAAEPNAGSERAAEPNAGSERAAWIERRERASRMDRTRQPASHIEPNAPASQPHRTECASPSFRETLQGHVRLHELLQRRHVRQRHGELRCAVCILVVPFADPRTPASARMKTRAW